jgi:hypothetical protein
MLVSLPCKRLDDIFDRHLDFGNVRRRGLFLANPALVGRVRPPCTIFGELRF